MAGAASGAADSATALAMPAGLAASAQTACGLFRNEKLASVTAVLHLLKTEALSAMLYLLKQDTTTATTTCALAGYRRAGWQQEPWPTGV